MCPGLVIVIVGMWNVSRSSDSDSRVPSTDNIQQTRRLVIVIVGMWNVSRSSDSDSRVPASGCSVQIVYSSTQ